MKKIILFICAAILISCSSTKRPMVITTTRQQADSNYESANNLIAYGKYELAKDKLLQSQNLAISIDDVYLLTRVCYSNVSLCLAQGDVKSAENYLSDAKKYYERCSKDEKQKLLGTQQIYTSAINYSKKENLESSLDELNKVSSNVKDGYYKAYLSRLSGDICVLKEQYQRAENYYLEAAKLHIKERYVAEVGQDYYSLARSRSLMGKKSSAIEAMEFAIKYDKDAENTLAIALDYFACAKILVKDNPTSNDIQKAKEYALWSKTIFATDSQEINKENIQKIDEFLKNI